MRIIHLNCAVPIVAKATLNGRLVILRSQRVNGGIQSLRSSVFVSLGRRIRIVKRREMPFLKRLSGINFLECSLISIKLNLISDPLPRFKSFFQSTQKNLAGLRARDRKFSISLQISSCILTYLVQYCNIKRSTSFLPSSLAISMK